MFSCRFLAFSRKPLNTRIVTKPITFTVSYVQILEKKIQKSSGRHKIVLTVRVNVLNVNT